MGGCILYGIILNLREKPLEEEIALRRLEKPDSVHLEIYLSSYKLHLFSNNQLIKKYRVVFGRNNYKKLNADDRGTPIGEYYICSVQPHHKYYKFLKISYPNIQDAENSLRKGLITQKQFDLIKNNYKKLECIPEIYPLGGNLGIHGIGKLNYIFKNLPFAFNWTNGSIAMSNENIDELIPLIKHGTKVIIKN